MIATLLKFLLGSRLGNLILLGTLAASVIGVQSWRLANAIEDRDTARTAFDNEKAAHKETKATLSAAAQANRAYADTVKLLQTENAKLAEAKKLQAEQAAKAIAEADARRRESDKVLDGWMSRYSESIRNPDCAKIMAMKSCVK